jgi:predicted CXXCH cytochrome family protein
MANPGRKSQKQIAEKYKGNLDYYNRPGFLLLWRGRLLWIGLLVGLVFWGLYHFSKQESFYNPGPISQSHAKFANDCEKCHQPTGSEFSLFSKVLVKEVNTPAHTFVRVNKVDAGCLSCHQNFEMHAPNVVHGQSCADCHKEHRTSGPMLAVLDSNCAACHNNAAEMSASADKTPHVDPHLFPRTQHPDVRLFEPPRPAQGYTKVFASFWDKHPNYRYEQTGLKDPNTLRYNHQRHEAADIPMVNGKKLDCAYCHQPDASGTGFRRLTFETACQACHSLQLDPQVSSLQVPHGRSSEVRAFLRSLPYQYATVARKQGLTADSEINRFVATHVNDLQVRRGTGEALEHEVFFGKPTGSQGQNPFTACTYCHEVTPTAAEPAVTLPTTPDRWAAHAVFNHASHVQMKCTECHNAAASTQTSDIIMPTKESCVACHSPKGGVIAHCDTCHHYHNPNYPEAVPKTATRPANALRSLMLSSAGK